MELANLGAHAASVMKCPFLTPNTCGQGIAMTTKGAFCFLYCCCAALFWRPNKHPETQKYDSHEAYYQYSYNGLDGKVS